jgi:hypothetical protein
LLKKAVKGANHKTNYELRITLQVPKRI